jgi:biotin carboxyl carrier protein
MALPGSQKFIARFGDTEEEIKVALDKDQRFLVEIDGVIHHVDARRFFGGTWSLVIDNQSYDVELEVAGGHESEGRYNTLVRGSIVRLTVIDERRARMGVVSKKFTVEGPQTIHSPMPGKVVKILVATGQTVEENQPLIIVEAMKMENELRSPKAGKIGRILVGAGQAVDAQAALLTVE